MADAPLRDDRESMSVPLVSLSKNKRTEPIEWRSANGTRFVRVTANATYGMATIWDYDVMIWAVSRINAAVEAGQPPSPTLVFHPHDLLTAIGRHVGGDHYRALEEALRRLKGTTVETNIRVPGRRICAMGGLLEDWAHETDETTGRSRRMRITLSRLFYDGVVKYHDVLAISPGYFKLTSGLARWFYRVARRHAGKQDGGFRLTMKDLHARSGSTQPYNQFARDARKVVAKGGVLEYRMDIIRGQRGDEVVTMVRDPRMVELPQMRTLARVKLPPPATICSGDGHGGSPTGGHGGSPTKTRRITHRNRAQLVDSKG